MTALAAPRLYGARRFISRDFRPLASGAKIFQGANMMAITSGGSAGYYQQAAAVAGVAIGAISTGRGSQSASGVPALTPLLQKASPLGSVPIDNTAGANGALYAEVEYLRPFWVFLLLNDTGTPVTVAMRESSCYCLDDQSVTGASGAAVCGVVYDVTSEGVWVKMVSQ
jgi:hypothetical protein